MVQGVSRRLLTAQDHDRYQANPCGIHGGQSGTDTGFFPSTLVLLFSIFPLVRHCINQL